MMLPVTAVRADLVDGVLLWVGMILGERAAPARPSWHGDVVTWGMHNVKHAIWSSRSCRIQNLPVLNLASWVVRVNGCGHSSVVAEAGWRLSIKNSGSQQLLQGVVLWHSIKSRTGNWSIDVTIIYSGSKGPIQNSRLHVSGEFLEAWRWSPHARLFAFSSACRCPRRRK